MRFEPKTIVVLVIAAASVMGGSGQSDEILLLKIFPEADSIHAVKWPAGLTVNERIESPVHDTLCDSCITFFRLVSHRRLIGYGFAASVQSKSSLLHVVLTLETNGVIAGVDIVNTNDPHSARLLSRMWKKQFWGKTKKTLGHIDALSGATISSTDIERTVRKLLAAFEIYR